MSITIREANAGDAAQLAGLRFALRSAVKATQEARDPFIERTTTWMESRLGPGSHWRCWIALDAMTIVGCVWIQRVEKLPNPNGLAEDNAYLSNFYVSESQRSTGIGSSLLHAALGWCDQSEIEITFLWPTERSRRLYERFGFSTKGGIMERMCR